MTHHKQDTIDAGFAAVAQSNVAVVHKTDSDCWSDEVTHYIPFATVEEGVAHGNQACSKCCREVAAESDSDAKLDA